MMRITESEFRKLTKFIEDNFGIHVKEEKKSILISKLENTLYENGCGNFTEYYEQITRDKSGDKVIEFVNKITTNHTFFMREAEHFYYFRDMVLPYLKGKIKDRDLRVWCAACSSGEEAYTLAMIIDEFFGNEKSLWDKKILATDLSTKVLNIAKTGIYSEEGISALPSLWKMNYLKKIDEKNYTFTDKLKNEVIYRRLNLIDTSFPFKKKFHVIFCRNVMIYFDNKTKVDLIKKFYDLTEPGGYLFIGHSESINREDTKYKYIRPSVYRKE